MYRSDKKRFASSIEVIWAALSIFPAGSRNCVPNGLAPAANGPESSDYQLLQRVSDLCQPSCTSLPLPPAGYNKSRSWPRPDYDHVAPAVILKPAMSVAVVMQQHPGQRSALVAVSLPDPPPPTADKAMCNWFRSDAVAPASRGSTGH